MQPLVLPKDIVKMIVKDVAFLNAMDSVYCYCHLDVCFQLTFDLESMTASFKAIYEGMNVTEYDNECILTLKSYFCIETQSQNPLYDHLDITFDQKYAICRYGDAIYIKEDP